MLLNRDDSCLLMIDVQEKLIQWIHEHDRVVDNCVWMCDLASALQIPIVWSEQYPRGLGATVARLSAHVSQQPVAKLHFSCAGDPHCLQQIRATQKLQMVLIGIEAHVCVLQTALELRHLGFDVFVVMDATSSRNPADVAIAQLRMQQAGVHLVTKEMVFFEWIRVAGTPTFKELSKRFLMS
jgi:nicotinamidase-related amidase